MDLLCYLIECPAVVNEQFTRTLFHFMNTAYSPSPLAPPFHSLNQLAKPNQVLLMFTTSRLSTLPGRSTVHPERQARQLTYASARVVPPLSVSGTSARPPTPSSLSATTRQSSLSPSVFHRAQSPVHRPHHPSLSATTCMQRRRAFTLALALRSRPL